MKNLFKKFMEFAIGNIVVLAFGLLATTISSRIISPYENGKYSMFVTVNSLLVLVITMGMDQAYVRYYHQESENNNGRFLRKCLITPLIINIIVGCGLLMFYKPISKFIIGEYSLVSIILLLINSTFNIISIFAVIHIRMKQRGILYSFINSINRLSYVVIMILLFKVFGDNYITLILSLTSANIIMVIFGLVSERKDWFNFKNKNNLSISTKELLSYGMPFIFSMAITWIFQSIDKISLKTFSSYEQIGLYSGAITIVSLLNILQSSFTTFWTPVAYERYSKRPNDKKFFILINEIVSFAMIFLSIVLITSKDIIVMLLGGKYREVVYIFPFLVFMPIMYTISETTVMGINFYKKTKYHIYVAFISALINVIGNFTLVPRFGATGAAISTGISYMIFFIVRTYFSRRLYNVNFNLKKFWICIIMVYILATYSSLHKFNYGVLALSIISLLTLLFMYENIIIELYKNIIDFIKKKN